MNAVMENLLTRRSVRAFEEKEIPQEVMEQLVQAALYAPSARGLQTWQFTVVTDRDKIQELAAVMAAELGRSDYDMYAPQALIIPSNEADSPYGREDNACALENIFLAAWSFGVGSVWINQLHGLCGRPAVREILKKWGIPDSHVVYGMAALGYPAQEQKKEVQKTGKVVYVQ